MKLKNFMLRYESTTLYFGIEAVENIRDHVKRFERVIIVTGKRSAKVSGAFDDVVKILNDFGISYTVYDNVSPNPWASQAEELAKVIWSEGADAVIAIGGGSPIDIAKIGTVLAANGGRVIDYLTGRRKAKRSIPLIAVNLTHGTGTEIDRHAVFTLDETKEKTGLGIKHPDVSVDDPRYTLTLDRRQTVYTSLDAFYHVYEASTAKNSNPFVESLSDEASRIIVGTLPKLVNNLNDIALRYSMLYASMIAGIAIDISPAHLIHVIEHAVSGLEPKVAHGSGLAMLGPRAAYYIHKAEPEASARILRHIDPSIKPLTDYAENASKAIAKFQDEVGFRERLSDYGFTEKDIDTIVQYVMKSLDWLSMVAPLQVTKDIVIDIVRSAL